MTDRRDVSGGGKGESHAEATGNRPGRQAGKAESGKGSLESCNSPSFKGCLSATPSPSPNTLPNHPALRIVLSPLTLRHWTTPVCRLRCYSISSYGRFDAVLHAALPLLWASRLSHLAQPSASETTL